AEAQLIITYDITAPTVTISSDLSSPTNISPIPIKVIFSESVNGFGSDEVIIGFGALTSFSGADDIYTIDVTPSSDDTIIVKIGTNVAQDDAGNGNTASTQFKLLYDGTPPQGGLVNDGPGDDVDTQTINTSISASWTGFSDKGTGIAYYEWAIGTSAGGTDVQDWVNVGTDTTETNSSLSLADGTYYVSVKATDNSGNVSEAVSSNGVIVDTTPPSVPANLSASAGDMIITLSWNANSESDLVKYLV
ncbi:uncharacterized protein METZ01_LOCUS470386, partial [marine metagenome]